MMQQDPDLLVTKRGGRKEAIDPDKVHRVLGWAAEGLKRVSVSQVELKSRIQFYHGIPTRSIQKMLIKSAADLITEENSDYQYMAARLLIFYLRKEAYGAFTPPPIYDYVRRMVGKGCYDRLLLDCYTPEDFEEMDQMLKGHVRDLTFSYAAIKQMEGKYLLQDRTVHQIYETPQFLYMAVAATLFCSEPPQFRMRKIRDFYDQVSTFQLSLPTPIMAGVRTPTRQYSSCVLIECGDSLDSINATASSVVRYVSQRAGIGINAGRIRALGSRIRGGEALHTGCTPFYKYFQAAVKSCSQGGIRGGAATVFYPIWHLEIETLLVLKNNRGVEENRVRHMDYAVQICRLFYERLKLGQEVTLFSPHEVPKLYEAFFVNPKQFETLYLEYEQNPTLMKKRVPALQLFSLLAQERASTGRIYIQHVDHCNEHSPFLPEKAPLRQSNLCMEVTLPTAPLTATPGEGEIALCTLGAINLGKIRTLEDFFPLARSLVGALDRLLDHQAYLLPEAAKGALGRRSLGIGVINLAYYLARSGVRYSDRSALPLLHRTFEAYQYALLLASCELAKVRGPCPKFEETRYAQGLLPIDTYKRSLDEICSEPLQQDWEWLRGEILKYGLRNSTLSCLMPSETSSQISNATNGIEPPRGYVSVKGSKDGILRQVVPELERLKGAYELLWDLPNNRGYLEMVGVMQKFVDQSISANTSYDPKRFPHGKVPVKQILQDLLLSYRLGVKTLYYHNTRDGMQDPTAQGVEVPLEPCSGGGCNI